MSQNHSEPVVGTRVRDIHGRRAGAIPGAFEIQERKRIAWICPCGCGDRFVIPIRRGPKLLGAWHWDGNRRQPTLAPSIKQLRGCKWHGHLTKGVWVPAGDSGR